MPTSVRSFAKINIGLAIGPKRSDGFHELRTVYQTIALHDRVRVEVKRAGGSTGIEIRSKDPRVPEDESNTCYRLAERVLKATRTRARVVISIDKQLPVQGGLGAASSNAVATLFGLERELKSELLPEERHRLAAEVGSDLPLFLVGGTVLGTGRGEDVFPLPDLPPLAVVVVAPATGVPTSEAFASWDRFAAEHEAQLTGAEASDRMSWFSRRVFSWLVTYPSGVPPARGDRAEAPLLDLVRAGIANDFERVVFPEHPELREVKRALERQGAQYASLSGSGASVYGLFDDPENAVRAAEALSRSGLHALATTMLPRSEYWRQMFE